MECKVEEDIPRKVVEHFDIMDDGDVSVPPRFSCEVCGGEMHPINYTGVYGQHYILDENY